MSDKTYIGKSANRLTSSPKTKPISKVVVKVSDSQAYSAGDDSGYVWKVSCPWGTQKIANDLLNKYKGLRYQPYDADGALLNPVAEIGDGVTIGGVYGGLYSEDITFGPNIKSDISAPQSEQIDHEYPYKPGKDREVKRQFGSVKSTLKVQAGLISAEVAERKSADAELSSTLSVQAGLISAKVDQTGGTEDGSFSYEMRPTFAEWKANGSSVLKLNADGGFFSGKLVAKSGLIGGMTIEDGYLHTGNGTWDHCEPGEIYNGPEGINHSDNFRLDSAGNITAKSGTFSGTVKAGKIAYGGDNGTLPGGGISQRSITGGEWGNLALSTVGTLNTMKGINDSLAKAETASSVLFGSAHCNNVIADYTISGGVINASSTFKFKGKTCQWTTLQGIPVITHI